MSRGAGRRGTGGSGGGRGTRKVRRRPPTRAAVVVGRRPALEAIRSGLALEVVVAAGARPTGGLRELLDAARSAAVEVRSASPGEVAALAEGARDQGVAARVRLPEPLSEVDLAGRPWEEEALVVALDGVTDPRNVGAIARTAEAAGAAALILRRRRGAGMTPAVVRASAGALIHLPVAEVANLTRTLSRLKEAGFWVVGLDARAPNAVGDTRPPPGRLVLVLGAEGEGMSRLVRRACDEIVAIPMRGRVESLNVSVAAGVALFGLRPPLAKQDS